MPRAVVVGGGLAGITAALTLADAGLRGHPGRRPPAARRTRLLLPARRADRRQRPARLPALLHRLPLVPRPDRRRTTWCTLQDRLDVPGARRGPAGRDRPAAPQRAAGAAAPGRLPRPLPAPVARRAGLRRPGRAGAARTRPGRPGAGRHRLRDLADRARPVRAHHRGAVGPGRRRHAERHRRDTSSLGLAAKVFKTGLLSDPGAADIGWARVPLGDLHARPGPQGAGRRGGATVLLRSRAGLPVTRRGRRLADPGQLGTGRAGRWRPDTVVLAVPQREAHALLPRRRARATRRRCCGIGTSPILNVHVVYDRQVLRRAVPRRARHARSSGSSTARTPPG